MLNNNHKSIYLHFVLYFIAEMQSDPTHLFRGDPQQSKQGKRVHSNKNKIYGVSCHCHVHASFSRFFSICYYR